MTIFLYLRGNDHRKIIKIIREMICNPKKDSEDFRSELLPLIRDAGRITKNGKPLDEDAVSGIK
jgi:hypothetical protein